MMKIFALKLDWFLWWNSAQIMRKWTGHVSHLKWVYVVITFMRAEWINLSGRPTQRLLCCYLLSVPSTNIIIPFNRSRWHFRNNIKINTNLPTPRSLHQHRRQNQPHSIRTVGVCMRVCVSFRTIDFYEYMRRRQRRVDWRRRRVLPLYHHTYRKYSTIFALFRTLARSLGCQKLLIYEQSMRTYAGTIKSHLRHTINVSASSVSEAAGRRCKHSKRYR